VADAHSMCLGCWRWHQGLGAAIGVKAREAALQQPAARQQQRATAEVCARWCQQRSSRHWTEQREVARKDS
jgi:hypothetical protein